MKLYSNEVVFKGHPDKCADQISDALLDAYLRNPTNMHSKKEDFALAKELREEKGDYGLPPGIQ